MDQVISSGSTVSKRLVTLWTGYGGQTVVNSCYVFSTFALQYPCIWNEKRKLVFQMLCLSPAGSITSAVSVMERDVSYVARPGSEAESKVGPKMHNAHTLAPQDAAAQALGPQDAGAHVSGPQ